MENLLKLYTPNVHHTIVITYVYNLKLLADVLSICSEGPNTNWNPTQTLESQVESGVLGKWNLKKR